MTARKPVIGVLALQGCVDRHAPHIEAAGGIFKALKTAPDIENADAYILPGGESTTMLTLVERFGLWETLAENFSKKPVWGICAGSILMAGTVWVDASRKTQQKSFGLMPVEIVRNGYGRQLESHIGQVAGYNVSFIRAPVVTAVPDTVQILAKSGDVAVWLGYGKHRLTSFHPELTIDYPSPMHRDFIGSIHT